MKYFLISTFILSSILVLSGQGDYFQQEVNYNIKVQLNDEDHLLKGEIEIEYINKAPEELSYLYFHLWPNAYKDQSTAFARQQRTFGDNEFFFAKKEDLGYIHQLQFKVDDQIINWSLDPENPDIAKLNLNEPLKSGESIRIHTPFELKIPASFSRLGHEGQSYQLTQWFPKPAVYDAEGWHAMPYLNMGEFYSEFGSFEVQITLPENYVVGATGTLQNEEEQTFLKKRIQTTNEWLANIDEADTDNPYEAFPVSSTKLKTLVYKAVNVHDFAWFADKRFMVQKSKVNLASGREVETWVMFNQYQADLWKNAINYMDESILFLSQNIGEYPYPQATAVQAALSAGGGMEYPMITVIDAVSDARTLDELILHEVGHNWFYGILATNERDHPWLDEGLNSFYEQRYNWEKYGNLNYNFLPGFLMNESEIDFLELSYLYQTRRNQDQAPETTSAEFSNINYFLSSYETPVRALKHLEAYLGKEKFDSLMQGYFQKWQFKHPRPSDLRTHLEKESGKDLSWMFDDYLSSTKKLDYRLAGVKEGSEIKITVQNKGDIQAPFPISALKNGNVIKSQWYKAVEKEQTLSFPSGDYDAFILDKERVTLDIYRRNNLSKSAKTASKLKLIPGIENDTRGNLFWFPALMWNDYDKLSAGILLYNTVVPTKKFQFYATPLFALNSKDLIGLAHLEFNQFPTNGKSKGVTLALDARSANFNYNRAFDFFQGYGKIEPSIKFHLPSKHSQDYHHFIKWRSLLITAENALFDADGFQGKEWESNLIHELSYEGESRRSLHPYQISAKLEQQSYKDAFEINQQYLKASIEWQPKLNYSPDKQLHLRFFAGGFISNSKRNGGGIFPGAFNMVGQGFYDYRFDGAFLGRSEGTGLWSQQVNITDGGFKNTIGTGFQLGRTNNFLLAINTKVDLPFDLPLGLPLKPYFDIGYFDNATPTGGNDTFKDQLMWSGGLALDWLDGLLGIYFPLFNSKNIQDRYAERGNFGTRISFSIDISKANPYYHINRISF